MSNEVRPVGCGCVVLILGSIFIAVAAVLLKFGIIAFRWATE
jgi:hypothetical protein